MDLTDETESLDLNPISMTLSVCMSAVVHARQDIVIRTQVKSLKRPFAQSIHSSLGSVKNIPVCQRSAVHKSRWQENRLRLPRTPPCLPVAEMM